MDTNNWPPRLLSRLEASARSASSETSDAGQPATGPQPKVPPPAGPVNNSWKEQPERHCSECNQNRPASWFIHNRSPQAKLVPECVASRRAAGIYREISIHSDDLAEAERLVLERTAPLVTALNNKIQGIPKPHCFTFTHTDLEAVRAVTMWKHRQKQPTVFNYEHNTLPTMLGAVEWSPPVGSHASEPSQTRATIRHDQEGLVSPQSVDSSSHSSGTLVRKASNTSTTHTTVPANTTMEGPSDNEASRSIAQLRSTIKGFEALRDTITSLDVKLQELLQCELNLIGKDVIHVLRSLCSLWNIHGSSRMAVRRTRREQDLATDLDALVGLLGAIHDETLTKRVIELATLPEVSRHAAESARRLQELGETSQYLIGKYKPAEHPQYFGSNVSVTDQSIDGARGPLTL